MNIRSSPKVSRLPAPAGGIAPDSPHDDLRTDLFGITAGFGHALTRLKPSRRQGRCSWRNGIGPASCFGASTACIRKPHGRRQAPRASDAEALAWRGGLPLGWLCVLGDAPDPSNRQLRVPGDLLYATRT
jgi:hypothetical protein